MNKGGQCIINYKYMGLFKNRTGGLHKFCPSAQITFEKILEFDDWVIRESEYIFYLENSKYKIDFWNANKWYSWGHRGELENKETGEILCWGDNMPRRKTAKAVIKHLEEVARKNI